MFLWPGLGQDSRRAGSRAHLALRYPRPSRWSLANFGFCKFWTSLIIHHSPLIQSPQSVAQEAKTGFTTRTEREAKLCTNSFKYFPKEYSRGRAPSIRTPFHSPHPLGPPNWRQKKRQVHQNPTSCVALGSRARTKAYRVVNLPYPALQPPPRALPPPELVILPCSHRVGRGGVKGRSANHK